MIVENEKLVTKVTQDPTKESKLYEPYESIPWQEQLLPDPLLLNEAMVACLKNIKDEDEGTHEADTGSIRLVLLLLLKISLLYKNSSVDLSQMNVIDPLLNICDEYKSKMFEIPTDVCEVEL